MRVLLLLFVSIQFAFSQGDPLFKIISCSSGVTVDGVQTTPGQFVHSTSKSIEIPDKGYLGVITKDGYTYEISESIEVKLVNKKVKQYVEGSKTIRTGTTHRDLHLIGIKGPPNNDVSKIYGDSLLVAIFDRNDVGSPYQITFLNVLEDILFRDTISRNWKIYDLSILFESEKEILVDVKSIQNMYSNDRSLIKTLDGTASTKLDFDLSRATDKLAITAIFEMYNLYYDHLFQLYKISNEKYIAEDHISQAYLSRREKYYQFNQHNFASK